MKQTKQSDRVGRFVDRGTEICYNKVIMAENTHRGKFIVFEGTDGSGKSTQLKTLVRFLEERGVPCYVTREPTDSPVGALLRSCLTGRVETDEHTIAALFAADRLDHIHNPVNGILKKLEEGVNVFCDRYYLSSFAYNGGFVPLEWVIALNAPAREMLKPDLTVFIDLEAETAMQRVARRGETERYETLEKQIQIRRNFYDMFERFPDENVAIVKSMESKQETQAAVLKAVEQVIKWKNH